MQWAFERDLAIAAAGTYHGKVISQGDMLRKVALLLLSVQRLYENFLACRSHCGVYSVTISMHTEQSAGLLAFCDFHAYLTASTISSEVKVGLYINIETSLNLYGCCSLEALRYLAVQNLLMSLNSTTSLLTLEYLSCVRKECKKGNPPTPFKEIFMLEKLFGVNLVFDS